MKSKDMLAQNKATALANLAEAMRGNDENQLAVAIDAYGGSLREELKAEAMEAMATNTADSTVLAARGHKPLTSAENRYWSEVIGAMKSQNPRNAIENIDAAMPMTIVDNVIGTIKRNHPILNMINFRNSTGLTRVISGGTNGAFAKWGPLGSQITEELSGRLSYYDVTLMSLTVFSTLPLDYLDLGPAWLNAFEVELHAETMAMTIEMAVVDGDGNGKPIGMTRNVTPGADSGGVYPRMEAIPISDLSAKTLCPLVAKLARDPFDPTKARPVGQLLMAVHPFAYWNKIRPATSFRLSDGSYQNDILPIPAVIEQSVGLPDENHILLGISKNYDCYLGLQGKTGMMTYSDEAMFLKNARTYKSCFQGNGRPTDAYSWIYLDITDLKTSLPILVEQVAGA